MRMRSSGWGPICLLALACQPAPTASPDTTADPGADPGGPTAALDTDSDADPVSSTGAKTPADSGTDSGTDSGAEPTEPTEPAAEPSSEPTEPAEPASAEAKPREPLPKPIHEPSDGSCVKKFAVGEQVKPFRLPSLAGDKSISPAGYRNRVVLLNFWATWCKPCLAELPEFDRLYRKYRRHGMTLVAVTTDEDPAIVQDFVDDHKLAAKIALGGEQAAGAYGRPNFPFSFVVAGDGTIVAAFDYVDDACLGDLEQVIREQLEQL